MSLLFPLVFFSYSQMLQLYMESFGLLWCLRFKACSFNSCFPQATGIVVWHLDVRFSHPAVFLSSSSRWHSRLLRENRRGVVGVKKEHLYGPLCKEYSHIHCLVDRVPSVGLWREERAQACSSLRLLPLVETVLKTRGSLLCLKGWRGEHLQHCKWHDSLGFLQLKRHTQGILRTGGNMSMVLNEVLMFQSRD